MDDTTVEDLWLTVEAEGAKLHVLELILKKRKNLNNDALFARIAEKQNVIYGLLFDIARLAR